LKMGQSTSLESPRGGGMDELDFLHEQIRKHSLTIRQLTFLTNEDFHTKINELNALSSKFVDCNSKQLLFEVKPGTEGSVLWKGTVRIKCVKLDSVTKKIEKSRELSLKQFLQVYNTLQLHLSASSDNPDDTNDDNRNEVETDKECYPGDEDDSACCSSKEIKKTPAKLAMNASILLDDFGKVIPEDDDNDPTKGVDDDSCCICMDSKPQVSLPCAHSYCLACIEQWNVDHKTCPICRETLETTDDTWVLEDRPNSKDVSQEIQKSLFDLTK